jgi:hypothetical protein
MKRFSLKQVGLVSLLGLTTFLAACDMTGTPTEELTAQETFTCRTTVTGTTKDVVFVPQNATCTLNNTNVEGNIIVSNGATLIARGVRVKGSIQSEGHARVTVVRSTSRVSTINGDIQIKQGRSATVTSARIGGSLQVEQNNGAFNFSSNTIGSDLQANANTGTGLTIRSNRINGNLQCQSNVPAPVGSGNVAASKEDQCARL